MQQERILLLFLLRPFFIVAAAVIVAAVVSSFVSFSFSIPSSFLAASSSFHLSRLLYLLR